MRIVFIALAALGFAQIATPASAGNCDFDWQSASDGSRCGGRSDWSRQGGSMWRGY